MPDGKPNILVIWGDDIGITNLSCYSDGLMGYRTPHERADVTSNTYYEWFLQDDYIALAATAVVAQFLETFKEFPPRRKAASFTIDQVVEKLETAITAGH